MTRKSEAITISCTPDRKEALELLAAKFGKTWGGKPNISELFRAIADGEIPLGDPTPGRELRSNITAIRCALASAQAAIDEIES